MEPILKYYTVQEIRNWLMHNQSIEGLSEKIIAPQRAWAIVHNPYVKDEDAVVCAIFENEVPVAYTAAFPELLADAQRVVWWFTTLYCHPSCQGKGYGMVVIGQLCELIGEGNFFDMDGAEETVSIFDYLGLSHRYIMRYVFTEKKIQRTSLKGRIAYWIDQINQAKNKCNRTKLLKQLKSNNYTIRYISYIDDLTYQFIAAHRGDDTFIRTQDMLNWIISYPFMQESPLAYRAEKTLEFSSIVQSYTIQAVQVWKNDQLVGVFIYRISNRKFSLNYLYYDRGFERDVFAAVAEHFITTDSSELRTTHSAFAQWLKPYNLTSKCIVEEQSFSYPDWFNKEDCNIQQGDGDVFV